MVAQLLHGVALLFFVLWHLWMENLRHKCGGGARRRGRSTGADHVGTRTQKRLSGKSGSLC